MIDDRVSRLLDKAERAIDDNNIEQSDAYASLASRARYIRAKEAKDLARMVDFSER